MGRSYTPKYRIEFTGGDFGRMMGWAVKRDGRPTAENIEKLVAGYVRSSRIGGVNEHLGKALGREMRAPSNAKIVDQTTGETVAEWKHPMFWVVA